MIVRIVLWRLDEASPSFVELQEYEEFDTL
jgi:hypothetical protein